MVGRTDALPRGGRGLGVWRCGRGRQSEVVSRAGRVRCGGSASSVTGGDGLV